MHENPYLTHAVPESQATNKVSKERDKRKHRSQEKKILSQSHMYGSLLEGKRHHALVRPDKINFF